MKPKDPNYELIKHFELNTWAEWGWQLDGNFSRHAPIGKYVEAAAKTLERVFDLLISLHDQVPVSERCRGLETFKKTALQTVREALGSQSKTLGEGVVNSAIREFSEKAQTLFDAAKKKLVDAELGVTKGRDQRSGESVGHHKPGTFAESQGQTRQSPSADEATAAKKTRAATVAKVIKELNSLKPQMYEDESEYQHLRSQYPDFLNFNVADTPKWSAVAGSEQEQVPQSKEPVPDQSTAAPRILDVDQRKLDAYND
jgi:hypothetical protein